MYTSENYPYTFSTFSSFSPCALTLSIPGLTKMHNLTSVTPRPVRFRAWLWNGTEYTLLLNTFQVLNKSTNYKLRLENFNGNASSAGIDQEACIDNFNRNTNQEFSTYDRDNDANGADHCSQDFGGAGYWYKSCTSISPNVEYCPTSSCGSNVKNIKVKCLKGDSYSMKRFQIDVLVM